MTNDKPLRDQLATAIWSVHRDNPREAILDGVMQLHEAECRRREVEARINELTYIRAFSGQPYAMSDINDRPLSIPDRIAELKATIRKEET